MNRGMHNIAKNEYRDFFVKLKDEITSARQKSYQTVNRQLVELYLRIGQSIYDKVEISKWGEGIIETLAGDLQKEFPDMKGFSQRNLWEMKKLYETYKNNEILQPLVAELSWSHNLIILHQTGSIEEKEFYLKTCINERWSRRELERQIDSCLYERFVLSRKTDKLVPHTKEKNILTHFKDDYLFDFLGLKDGFSEQDLRRAIVENLKEFFLEFGRYFTFVGEEYKISVGNEDYKLDLQFYLSALDEKVKLQDENPSVGLILCKSKNEDVVRIAISKSVSPMKVATYKAKIIDASLLKRKLHSLPLPEKYLNE